MNENYNRLELERELNAQCLLFMYFVNNEYYKQKYDKAMQGTLSSAIFGVENERKKFAEATELYKAKTLEMAKAGYHDRKDSRIAFLISNLFINDQMFENRIKWGMQFVLSIDSLFEKAVVERGLSTLSKRLGFMDNALFNLLNVYKDNWSKIQINYTANRNMAIASGAVAFLALTVLTNGLALMAPGPLGVTLSTLGGGSLATGGLGMAGGCALLSLVSVAGAASIGGVVYKAKNAIDKRAVLNNFKNMSLEELSYSLAASLTFVQFSKVLNGYSTTTVKEVISVLIDVDADIKNDYLINYNGADEYLKNKNIMMRNAFIKLEKCF